MPRVEIKFVQTSDESQVDMSPFKSALNQTDIISLTVGDLFDCSHIDQTEESIPN
jgi:hypothetical protein